jgi:hypothetical protein
MQVRLGTYTLTEDDRRAVRFVKDKRKTMCSRKEAVEFIDNAVNRALRDLRYRWHGPQVSEAVLNGADSEGVASHEEPAIKDETVTAPEPEGAAV